MKRIILLPILTLAFFLHAQEKLNYQLNGRNIEFTVSQEEIYVEYRADQKRAIQQYAKQGHTEISQNSAIVKMGGTAPFQIAKQNLQSKFPSGIKRIEPVLVYSDGTRQIAKGELNIKLKPGTPIETVLKGRTFDVQLNGLEENLYLVSMDLETTDLFQLVNQLQVDDRIEFSEPNYIRMIKPHTNDPFYNNQWAIKNQGYLGGTVGADMDVEEAWGLATGSGIKIAIIDEGVDLTHPDLTANLLPGYDATDLNLNGAPNESTNDGHGTACAGIAAAVGNNNIGIAGVAYNAQIIPVRIAYSTGPNSGAWINSDSWTANGINWAWQNGADVLSNSYGGGSYSQTIVNAINNAVNNGRNGKGSVVLFSSGNDVDPVTVGDRNGNPVSFPASASNAIAVGATSMCDERKTPTSCDGENWGSNFGNALDIVAPGVQIYATDISGPAGYRSGDYVGDFNGTSSACPNAAGVAALILSVNPNFTQAQVREILETTTDKIGSYNYNVTFQNYGGTQTWNNEVGYGRVNAFSAVQKAINYDNYYSHFITGPTQITPGTGGFYKISNPYTSDVNYVWSIPFGCHSGYCWQIVQGQGTDKALIYGGSIGVQDIICKIYDGNTLINQQRITVNVQNPYNGGGEDPCGGLYIDPNVIYPPVPCEDGGFGVNSVVGKVYFKHLTIYNLQGQKVLETSEKQEINISHLSSGIYIVKAELSNNEILTKKIIRK